eukprot:SM000143S00771  [mRNA]  locus=s143:339434:340148:- [translate_table: standard]
MTRGKQKIEAQKRNAERGTAPKGSQLEARAAALKTACPICKSLLANYNQLVDHYSSKHPKEPPPPLPPPPPPSSNFHGTPKRPRRCTSDGSLGHQLATDVVGGLY